MSSHIGEQSHHSAVNFTTALNALGSFLLPSFRNTPTCLLLLHPCFPSLQVLQSLSLTESRLRSRGTVLVNALGSNTCLRKVDLSGNNMDDIGAKMLSKALQINTTLR